MIAQTFFRYDPNMTLQPSLSACIRNKRLLAGNFLASSTLLYYLVHVGFVYGSCMTRLLIIWVATQPHATDMLECASFAVYLVRLGIPRLCVLW